jgi:L-alanine-DL-glutamate epimerase-like enolase superfamily enzyme
MESIASRVDALAVRKRTDPPDRIEAVRLVRLRQRQEDPSWRYAGGAIPFVAGIVVEIASFGGAGGVGYVEVPPIWAPDFETSEKVLREMGEMLVGQDPLALARLAEDMEEAFPARPFERSGMDCALHDLAANSLGVRLYQLLGGRFRDEIPCARLIPLKAPEEMADHAENLARRGYPALKIKLDGDLDLDARRVEAIRQRCGESVKLTADANQAYTSGDAITLCTLLAKHDVLLIEQPVPAQDTEGLARVTANAIIAVEADEAVASVRDVVRLINGRAAHSYNLKLGSLGGLHNTLLAARICESAGVWYRVGALFGPRIMAAQATHMAAAFPKIHIAAELAEFDHILDDPFRGFEVEGGTVRVPDEVGSGVTWVGRRDSDGERISAHPTMGAGKQ